MKRARLRHVATASMLFVALYVMSPLGSAGAAQPGSITITSLGCYPAISVDIRVGALATGDSKTNVLRMQWSDGRVAPTHAPEISIPPRSAGQSNSDIYHVDWFTDDVYRGSFTASGTATLVWQLGKGNTKEVATTTATHTCSI